MRTDRDALGRRATGEISMEYDKECIEQLKEINKAIQEINENLRKELQNELQQM